MKKNISLIGSTGSIGKQTLEIVRKFPDLFSVSALAAGSDWRMLAQQIEEFRPALASVKTPEAYQALRRHLPTSADVRLLQDGSEEAACSGSDMAVIATVGISGLKPVVAALENRIPTALATKEALVSAGELVMELSKKKNTPLIPIDSEHSAVLQCIGDQRKFLNRIILTSSGGPFRGKKAAQLKQVTLQQALKHPTWKMGRKITVDSATLMNKGFEMLEAAHLFSVGGSQIEVLVHPQSIVHSLVEFSDGAVLAQLSPPDMRLAIQYALSWPQRLDHRWQTLKLWETGNLSFEKPDTDAFPCLRLAYAALNAGKTAGAALNGANEIAVEAFLEEKIRFHRIPEIVEKVLERHENLEADSLDNIAEADEQARRRAEELVKL